VLERRVCETLHLRNKYTVWLCAALNGTPRIAIEHGFPTFLTLSPLNIFSADFALPIQCNM